MSRPGGIKIISELHDRLFQQQNLYLEVEYAQFRDSCGRFETIPICQPQAVDLQNR